MGRQYSHGLKLPGRQVMSKENDLAENQTLLLRIFCKLRVACIMKNKTPNWFSENQVLLCPSYKCNFPMKANKPTPWRLV